MTDASERKSGLSLKDRLKEFTENPENQYYQDRILIDNLPFKNTFGRFLAYTVDSFIEIKTKEGWKYFVERCVDYQIQNNWFPTGHPRRLIEIESKDLILYAVSLKFDKVVREDNFRFILDLSVRGRVEEMLDHKHPHLGKADAEIQFSPSEAFRIGRDFEGRNRDEALQKLNLRITELTQKIAELESHESMVADDVGFSEPNDSKHPVNILPKREEKK